MKSGLEQTVGGPLSIFSTPPVTPAKAATITTGVFSQMFADLKKERREKVKSEKPQEGNTEGGSSSFVKSFKPEKHEDQKFGTMEVKDAHSWDQAFLLTERMELQSKTFSD